MDERELFAQNPWWGEKGLIREDYYIAKWNEREYKWVLDITESISLEPCALHIIIGPKRVGKTTTLKLLIRRLLESREPKSIFYFNCENLADHKELLGVLNSYLQFRKVNSIGGSVILLDEITFLKEWHRAIKSLLEQKKIKEDVLIITDSSDIAVRRDTELFPGMMKNGGNFAVYPLSFRSFLGIMDKELLRKIQPINRIKDIEENSLNALLFEDKLDKYLKKYMGCGGFPFSMSNPSRSREEAKKAYLAWIKNTILKSGRSDIIARQIIGVLIENSQTPVSWGGISKKIDAKSPKTVAAYVNLLKSIFCVNVLHNVDIIGNKIRFGRNKKIYFRDPTLLEICEDWCLVKPRDRESAVAETLLIEHLSRMFPDKIFFWKNGFEIDVIVLEKDALGGRNLYGFDMGWSGKSEAKGLDRLKKFVIITKKEYSKYPLKIPLSVFLSLLEV